MCKDSSTAYPHLRRCLQRLEGSEIEETSGSRSRTTSSQVHRLRSSKPDRLYDRFPFMSTQPKNVEHRLIND